MGEILEPRIEEMLTMINQELIDSKFKEHVNAGLVLTGGMHATVAPDEMEAVEVFDKICMGPGEKTIVDLVKDLHAFPRVFPGQGAKSMAEWPNIDRTLWPQPAG